MRAPARHRRLGPLAVAVAAGIAAVSCGTGARRAEPPAAGTVVITVDLQRASWEASGSLVDEGVVCPGGFRRAARVPVLDAATRAPISSAEVQRRRATLTSPREQMDVIFVTENTCADGSGSFVSEQNGSTSAFTVVDGVGAYRSLRGRGDYRWTSTFDGTPESLVATVKLRTTAS